jgi:hypothetical protein
MLHLPLLCQLLNDRERPVLDVLADLASRVTPPGVLLERDENFPEPAELERELAEIRDTVRRASAARTGSETEKTPETEKASEAPETPATPATAATAATAEPLETSEAGHGDTASSTDPARQRLGLAQASLLSALVAGTPVPEGFDRVRLGVQARALGAKRADVVATVAPELAGILGESYRPAFLTYAHGHPMGGGYRRDALDFAEHLLLAGRPEDAEVGRRLREWWLDRSGPAPRSERPTARLARATRRVLLRR